MSPPFAADWNDTSTISTIKHGLRETMGRSEGMATVLNMASSLSGASRFLRDSVVQTQRSKSPRFNKAPCSETTYWFSPRTVVGQWPAEFSASTKAKLSHLEAGSVFRDPHSPLTPAANLFPSGGSFFGGGRCRISTQWSRCWWPWRAISYFHQLRLSSGLEAYASLCRAVTLCVYWS